MREKHNLMLTVDNQVGGQQQPFEVFDAVLVLVYSDCCNLSG